MELWGSVFLGGVVIIAWIYFWSRQRKTLDRSPEMDRVLNEVPSATKNDAVIVSREHGQLIYVNDSARRWLNMNGDAPHLERIARLTTPANSFLELFAEEGQSSFQLGERWVEASSHRIPNGAETRTVVVMRELSANTSHPDALDLNKAMSIINQIGDTINAGMGVDEVLQTMLLVLQQAVEFDAGEICLYDEERQLLIPRGWSGDPMYLLALDEVGGVYHLGEGIGGWVAKNRQSVLVEDRDDPAAVQPKLQDTDFESFVAVPLLLGENLLGTLEFASKTPGTYGNGDVALLQAISKALSVSIYNTQIYADQVRRIDDIASIQQITHDRDLNDGAEIVYQLLNQRIAELLSADMSGIFLYDDVNGRLDAVPPFFGLPDALVRTISIPLPEDSPQRDIWERQPNWISNDVPDDPLVEVLGLQPIVGVAGIKNTAWFPLGVGRNRIGVLAVSNKRTEGGFGARDVQHLTVLSSQASIIVENIRLFQRERRIDAELAGLQEITHAVGALRQEGEFYSDITSRIARLMSIEMCGILLFDEATNHLVAKPPFAGVADDLIAAYRIDLGINQATEELWTDAEVWFSNRVQSDTLVYATGLDQLAEAVGVQKTLFASMSAGGRRIGVVQASNKISGEDFTDNDARLLLIFATQAAAMIENARLLREVQRSAEEAQSLRRLAEMAGAVLTTQETFVPVLDEIARLMDSEMVFVSVLDRQSGSLVTYPRWVHGVELTEPIVQDIYAPKFEYSVAVSHTPYLGNDVLNDPRVLPGYMQISRRMGITSSIIVPLIVGDETLGELGVGNRITGLYTEDDVDVMKVVAAQIASALQRLIIYEEAGQNLNRRMEELDAISRVSNELTLTVDLERVLDVIRDEAIRASNADDGTVVLVRDKNEWRSSSVPEMSQRIGARDVMIHGLADIEADIIARGSEPILVDDYEFSAYDPEPTSARSAVAAPIIYLDEVVGIIHLFHFEGKQFDDRAVAFLMTLATKGALAYGNFVRYREQIERSERLRRRVDQLNRIFELGHMFHGNADPVSIMEAIAFSVQQSVGFDVIVMTMVDDSITELRRVTQAGIPLDQFTETQKNTMSVENLNTLLKDTYRRSEDTFFFPVEDVGNWYVENINTFSTAFDGNRTVDYSGKTGWRDGDMLLVRLRGATGNLIGVMSLDRPYDNRRPDQGTMEVLEIFAHQAATTIENIQLFVSSRQIADQEARLNEVSENIARSLDYGDIVKAAAQGALSLMPISKMTVALLETQGANFQRLEIAVSGDNRAEIVEETQSDLMRTAMRQSFLDQNDYYYDVKSPNLSEMEDLEQWYQEGERATLILPLLTGGQCFGVVHIGIDNDKNVGKLLEMQPIFKRMTQLVASSIQNARLFNQAVDLQILNESVVESIQQGIVVLDKSGRIISANSFMESRYDWINAQAVGKDLFTYQPKMADMLADDLRQVLDAGQQHERINQTSILSDGSILVRNFYTYPLRSGDTIQGAVLLVEDVTERARLEQAMESRANQLSALTDASTRITSSLEREDVITLALEEMGWLIAHDTMSVWRRNGSYMVMEGKGGLDGQVPHDENARILFAQYELVRQIVDSQRVVVFGDSDSVPHPIPGHEGAESWMGIPLVNQGHVTGMFVLTDDEKHIYDSTSDQNIAFAFASQVAIALANADLFEQTFDRTNELGTLLEAAQATSLTQDLDTVFRTIVELMFSALDMDDCAIMIWDEVDNALEVQVDMNRYGDKDRITPKGTRYDLSEYVAKMQALRDREVMVIMLDEEDSPYKREIEELKMYGDTARMLVPLVVREQSIGLIQLEQKSTDNIVTQQKVRLAKALGANVATAVQNARLTAEMSEQFNELMIINELSRLISSTLSLNDMIEIVAKQVPDVTGSDELYLALFEEATQEIIFPLAVRGGERYTIPPRKLNTDEVSFIIRHKRPLNLGADYFSPDELRKSLGITNGEGDAKSYLGMPITSGKQVLGVLALRDSVRTRAFAMNDHRILETVSSQLGAAIQNARLFEQIRNFNADLESQVAIRTEELEASSHELEIERDRIDTLYQITSELARSLDMDRLLQKGLSMVAKAIVAQDGIVTLPDPITDQLYSRAMLNPENLIVDDVDGHAYHPGEFLAQWLIDEGERDILIEDLNEFEHWNKDIEGASEWRSAIAVALEANDDPQGVMVLLHREVGAFDEPQLRMVIAAGNQIASAINNSDLYQIIRDNAERLSNLLRQEQEEAEKNAAILEGIADGVILADDGGLILRFNQAAERILNITRDQALGQPLSKLTGIYGGTAAGWAQAMERNEVSSVHEALGEYIDERVDLGDKIVSIHLSPVYTGEKFLGTVSVFRDVTREVEAERSKSQFISGVSHEFRTPLTPIKGYTDLLLMGATGEINDKQRMILKTIKDNVDRLAVLVEDVLKISQIDSGKETLKLQEVNLGDLVETVVNNVKQRSHHQNKALKVTVEVDPHAAMIEGDLEKMTRIISNLVDNAFNYNKPDGSIDVRVKVDEHNRRNIQIAVADTGVGIPKDFYERVWKRFERHDETAVELDVAGTGLGMPIVKELVEMHGGDVWFESSLGVGTTFYVSLPVKQPEYRIPTTAVGN